MPTAYELETLVTYFTAEVQDLKSKLREVERAFKEVKKVADTNAKGVEGALSGVGKTAIALAGTLVGVGGTIETAFSSIRLAAEAEQLEASFEVLLGSVEQSKKTLGELRDFALATPFRLSDIVEAAKQMTAFGETADNLVPTMRRLGEVSSAFGDKLPLKELAYLYGTLKAQGRAFTVDIRQFAGRGIPIYTELAKVMGLVSATAKEVPGDVRQKLEKAIESGQVTFDVVERAFKNMTSPGGMFFGQLEKQSKTLIGLFNQMKEEIETSLKTIGATLIESFDLKHVVRNVSQIAQQVNTFLQTLTPQTKEAIKIVAVLTMGFVALAAAIFVAGTIFNIMTGGLGIWIGLATVAIAGTTAWAMSVGGLERAWKIVKRAASDFWDFVEPILPALGVMALAVTGPVGAIAVVVALLVSYWDDVSDAVNSFWTEARPVLRAVWDLVKTIGFSLRAELIKGFKETVDFLRGLPAQISLVTSYLQRLFYNLDSGAQRAVAALVLLGAPFAVIYQKLKGLDLLNKNTWRDFAIRTEYAWKNFSSVVEVAIFKALMRFEQLRSTIHNFFVNAIPVYFKFFVDGIETMFGAALKIGVSFLKSLLTLLVDGVLSLPDLLAGKITAQELFDKAGRQVKEFSDDAKKHMEQVKFPPPQFPDREVSQYEKDLRQRAIDMEESLNEGFDAFRKNKLRVWEKEDVRDAGFELGELLADAIRGIEPEVDKTAAELGNVFASSFGKSAAKWDAVLFDSAEARARLQEYKDSFGGLQLNKSPAGTHGRTGGGLAGAPDAFFRPEYPLPPDVNVRPTSVTQVAAPPPNTAETAMVELLTKLLESSRLIEKKSPVVLEAARIES